MNKNKSHAALNYFRDNNTQLACLSETWFQDENNYQTALFSDSGSFTSYNRPRKTDTIGGGVCIFIKNFYKSTHQKKTSYSAFELLYFKLTKSKIKNNCYLQERKSNL